MITCSLEIDENYCILPLRTQNRIEGRCELPFFDFRTSSVIHTDEWHNYCEWVEMAQSGRWLWVACTPVCGSRLAPYMPGVTTGKKCCPPGRSGTRISSSYRLQPSYYAWATHLTPAFLGVCEFTLLRYNSKLPLSVCSHCFIFTIFKYPFQLRVSNCMFVTKLIMNLILMNGISL
jgi:hypothetical protein